MQVVTVVKLKNNTVEELHAFNGDGHEDVSKAESKFIELGKSIDPSIPEQDWEILVSDGHIEHGEYAVNLVWAENQITTLAVIERKV
jgi:hypothetical protein